MNIYRAPVGSRLINVAVAMPAIIGMCGVQVTCEHRSQALCMGQRGRIPSEIACVRRCIWWATQCSCRPRSSPPGRSSTATTSPSSSACRAPASPCRQVPRARQSRTNLMNPDLHPAMHATAWSQQQFPSCHARSAARDSSNFQKKWKKQS